MAETRAVPRDSPRGDSTEKALLMATVQRGVRVRGRQRERPTGRGQKMEIVAASMSGCL